MAAAAPGIIPRTMFTALSSWLSHCESSLGSSDECRSAPDGANPQTKPVDFGRESACRLPFATSTIAIYYYSARRLILILPSHGEKAESTYSWLVTYPRCFTHMKMVTHPSTNLARRWLTSLIWPTYVSSRYAIPPLFANSARSTVWRLYLHKGYAQT